jgi:hypothetical protein
MSTAVVALIVGLLGATVSLFSAIAAWRRDKATISHETGLLGLEQLKFALETQDLQIKRLVAETIEQAKRIDELEGEVSTVKIKLATTQAERDILKRIVQRSGSDYVGNEDATGEN